MGRTLEIIAAFGLDLWLGDRPIGALPHPVVVIGKAIERLERWLRRRFPATPEGELQAGAVLATVVPLSTFMLSAIACRAARKISPLVGFALETVLCWQALALRGLWEASGAVEERLEAGDLPGARDAVGAIVGRDVASLDEAGVARATVETVAENFADGVVAPLTFIVVGGAPAALGYKAINTLDSMVGYRNARYEYFGRASARLDDCANFVPARLAAFFWIGAAALDGQDARGALRIWRRDRRAHPSPNSAQCESACAGALGVELGGSSTYGGVVHEKPRLGDSIHPITTATIGAARTTLLVAGGIALGVALVACGVRSALRHLWKRGGR